MKAIKPFPVNLFGEQLNGYLAEDRQVYVVFEEFCALLGLANRKQRQQFWQGAMLKESLVRLSLPPFWSVGQYPHLVDCVGLNRLPYLLSQVDVNQVKIEHRLALIELRQQLVDVIANFIRPAEISIQTGQILPGR